MFNKTNAIKVESGNVFAQGNEIRLEYPVIDAFQEGNKIIVLFDSDAETNPHKQFPNLTAIDFHGQRLWTAELPTTRGGDRYYQISSRNPLIADSIYSYNCEIDSQTGRIKQKIYYK